MWLGWIPTCIMIVFVTLVTYIGSDNEVIKPIAHKLLLVYGWLFIYIGAIYIISV